MKFKLLLALILTSLLSACASVKYADASLDAEAKTYFTPPNKAAIYIYRNEFMGNAVTFDVFL
ncbi:MAG: hypothetical protein V2I33_15420, partial [Kangiellaceae bacterium]|nr:hypothetical protein [Kangiellaceae bacterium]